MKKPEPLGELRKKVLHCTRCRLHQFRTMTVLGEGDPHAVVMFVGEAPGRQEDRTGRPFVGVSGRIMGQMLETAGLEREEVYLTSVVKCRPPKNRDPREDEIRACLPHLQRQISVIRPTVICALGRIAAQALLGIRKPLSRIRGRTYCYDDAFLIATYHPAAVRRNPVWRRKTVEDMKELKAVLKTTLLT